MPPKTRALWISASALEKLAKDRGTLPGTSGDSTEKATSSPKNDSSTWAAAPLTVEWPEGYSGCGGVTNNGLQVASAAV